MAAPQSPPRRLLAEVMQVLVRHHRLEPEGHPSAIVDRVDAVAHADQANPVELAELPKSIGVTQIAGEAVSALSYDDIDPPTLDKPQKLVEAFTGDGPARHGVVGQDPTLTRISLIPRDELAAETDLVVDAGVALVFAREASVDRNLRFRSEVFIDRLPSCRRAPRPPSCCSSPCPSKPRRPG
jgi:hypothetical protein